MTVIEIDPTLVAEKKYLTHVPSIAENAPSLFYDSNALTWLREDVFRGAP